ncbi:MAG: molybdopterin-dependent oxidoreductase [Desulfobacterales bacterium]|nr:molybdopterin-dependent oxidoreductase [Desulfobacterales bacterium]
MRNNIICENGVVQTLCRQCDMHCRVNAHMENGVISRITGCKPRPGSRGRICAKASAAVDLVYHPDRLLRPLKKRPDGSFRPISLERAMDEIAGAMERIRDKHGARSLGAWTGEAIGFQQQEAYARRFIHAFGSPNYFSAESLCFASRYIAHFLTHGYYNGRPDFENAKTIVLWGANPAHSHPPYHWAIQRARERGARLIVVDPRRTAAARKADLFVQLPPGADAALAWGLARCIIEADAYDKEFVEKYTLGFPAFAERARWFTPDRVTRETGVPAELQTRMARLMMEGRPRVVNYTGISLELQPNALNTERVIVHLTGLCGAVDRRGGDTWPLDPPLRDLTLYETLPLDHLQPIGRDRFPALYHFRKQCHSMTAMDFMLGKGEYPLRGLLLTGANPALTNPDAAKVIRALERLDLFVVRDLFLTQTARCAHYVLPAASFLERSELHYFAHRQAIGITTKILDFPDVVDEYTFWRDLARRLPPCADYFPWKNEEEVNRWLLEPSGVSPEMVRAQPDGHTHAPPRYQKYKTTPFPTPSGKFEFVSRYLKSLGHSELPEYAAPPVRPHADKNWPLALITGGRYPLYCHSRFRNIKRLRRAAPEPTVDIHPRDAAAQGIEEGDVVRVEARSGAIELKAHIQKEGDLLPGTIHIGHGWDEANVNLLTDDGDHDPVTGYPNMKLIPARMGKAGNKS